MSWICIGIIMICGLIIIPLFGRIQNRILVLMSIFFEIEKQVKLKMVFDIQKFKELLKPDFIKKQSKVLKIKII